MAYSHVRAVALPLFPGSVLFAAEPPAPAPTPTPGSGTGAPGGVAPPPPGKRFNPWLLIVGCGCLVALAILAIIVYTGYATFRTGVSSSVQDVMDSQAPQASGPSEEAAIAAALHEVPGTAEVATHSDDWTTAVVNVTAEGIDEPVPVQLHWNASASAYKATVPVGSDIVPDPVNSDELLDKPLVGDGEATPVAGGGEDAVVAKALSMCPDQSWSVGVNRHNEDWTTVSVRMGPTPQQLVVEIDFIWDPKSKGYISINTRSLTGD